MGLPDFHITRGSYQYLDSDTDSQNIPQTVETTVFEYTGYGEIVSLEIVFYANTASPAYTDVIKLYLEGINVEEYQILQYLERIRNADTSIIIPVFFSQMQYFIIKVKNGLLFHESIKITCTRAGALLLGSNFTSVIGVY